MKQYLLVDLMGDYRAIMSAKELKEMVVNHIVEDTLQNCDDEDIVRTNTLLLEEMIKKEPKMEYIKEELMNYSYKVIDLLDLQRDLEDMKMFYGQLGNCMLHFDKVINAINEYCNKEGK